MWWKKFKKEILDTDLYSHSGTEVGLSAGVLSLVENDGDYQVKKKDSRDIPKAAYQASPDRWVDYPALNQFVFGCQPSNWLVGKYQKIFIGYCTDKKIRQNAASGGILSGIQNYLLVRDLVDGVITLVMRKDKPYLAEPIIATTKAEVMAGAQSKYAVAPVNQILAALPGKFKSLVYTGLPHEVVAIRKLQKIRHKSVEPIKYVIGPFFGEAIGFGAVKSFLRSHGVKDLREIKSLAYRAGEWPGYMRVELKTGRIISVPKFHANYLIPSHITKFSLYQVDYMNELADIAVGDAWAPKYEERGQGWSVVIARSQKGLDLLHQMKKEKAVYLEEITVDDLIDMHSHGLDLKKRGAFIRIASRKKKGLPVPEYGYKPTNISSGRVRFEMILSWLFKFFQARTTIWFLERLPVGLMGWFFIQARKIWKKRTKSSKNGGLSSLKFIRL